MKLSTKSWLVAGATLLNLSAASAATTTLNFNYIATNLYGSSGVANVASITVTDLADLGLNGEGYGGVRVQLTAGDLAQFSSGVAGTKVWISSFELNFPGTSTDNGYEFNNQHWSYVSGVNLAPVTSGGLSGGIEWQEDGATDGWGAAAGDPAFEQEYNFSAETLLAGTSSTIDLYNSAGFSGISVANLLNPANAVENALHPEQADALGWIKLRGTGNADPALRGVAGSGFWGNSATGGNPAQYRLNVLAMAMAPVPLPAALPLFLSALAGIGLIGKRRSR
ncbi:VPLPA-CTERM sorting domain-containing protein [Methylomonas sp. MED-D]|uniref:VPLPA-CTERM sorting domain-containing protein n=1 Tax=unclassified Methylomonas TaxID=2608980 RepID=UPI0028A3DED3|nr:VPLPA-CTERM sorting domain-containing protein [Methylomonas sp. MV1]MDT4331524.1 VPLPA-CTERM sorting domain-containing protein [Methylomonas sp. MV1]